MLTESITVCASPAYPLDGILTLPDGCTGGIPAAVLVHGSGPQDMDEAIGACKPFRDIADFLAQRGVATLRYNKRSLTYGRQMVDELGGALSVEEETIQDAVAAAALLRADSRVNPSRVFIVGHSLGGMLAPRIDAEGGGFAGLAILAGTMRTLDEVILNQNADALKQMDEVQRAEILPQVQALKEQFDSITGMSEAVAKQTVILPQSNLYAWYLKEMKQHPAGDYLAKTQKPVFVLQGDKDVHVSVEKDFGKYQALLRGRPNAQCKLYPGLNHLFMKAIYGTIQQVMEEYKVPQTMDDTALEDIAQWILLRA